MGKYTNLAKDIVTNVGGKENIISLKHCITRLRFKLKDESIANDDILNNMDGVVTVMKAGGQYQVVIGNHVTQIFDEVNQVLGITETTDSNSSEEAGEKQGVFNAFIDVIFGIFQPILVALSAAGVIKGFNTLFVSVHWYSQTSGTYNVSNAIGDSMFTFLPILLGLTAAKKFNLNQYVGLIIGASLCYPAIQLDTLSKAGKPLYTLFNRTLFQFKVYQTFLGISLISMNYTSTVIPVILICYFASKIEKSLNKVIPDMIKFFFIPIITLLVSLTLGFLVIGPLATFGSNLVGSAILAVRNFSPLVAGFWQVLVVFGLHWGIIPIYFNNIVTNGFDNVMMPYYYKEGYHCLSKQVQWELIKSKSLDGEKIVFVHSSKYLGRVDATTWSPKWALQQTVFDEYIYTIEDEDIKMADVLEKHGLSEHTLIKNQKEFIDMSKPRIEV